MSAYPTCEQWTTRVGSAFRCAGVEGAELTLTGVVSSPPAPGFEQYTLEFTGPANAPLAQATYALHDDVLGERDVFLVPVGADAALVRYEAVFSVVTEPRDRLGECDGSTLRR